MKGSEAFCLLLTQAPAMIANIHRWSHYAGIPRPELEDVLTHSYRAVLVAGAMLSLEEVHGQHKGELDHTRILMAAALHDIGEGRIGDVRFAVKQDPRIKDDLRQIEREQIKIMFHDLPPEVHELFWQAICLEDELDTLEGRFFNAIERLGYIYLAVPFYRRGIRDFIETFRWQHPAILELEREFTSLRILYDPYRNFVAREIDLQARADALAAETGAYRE